jgi:hypothetical protein
MKGLHFMTQGFSFDTPFKEQKVLDSLEIESCSGHEYLLMFYVFFAQLYA